jgi:hypothetical protein
VPENNINLEQYRNYLQMLISKNFINFPDVDVAFKALQVITFIKPIRIIVAKNLNFYRFLLQKPQALLLSLKNFSISLKATTLLKVTKQ